MEVKETAVPTTLDPILDPNISHLRIGSSTKNSWKLENGTMLQKATPTCQTLVKDKVTHSDHLPKSRKYLFFGKVENKLDRVSFDVCITIFALLL